MNNYKFQIDDKATAKGGLISLSVFTIICIGLFVYFYLNYDAYSETVYSLKRQANVQRGWGPTIVGWGYFAIPFFLFGIFLLAMTRDFKQVGTGIADDHLFVNVDGIRATKIEFSEIKELSENEHSIEIKLKDYKQLIANQFVLFRGVKRSKYVKKGLPITLFKSSFEEEDRSEVYPFLKSKVG